MKKTSIGHTYLGLDIEASSYCGGGNSKEDMGGNIGNRGGEAVEDTVTEAV